MKARPVAPASDAIRRRKRLSIAAGLGLLASLVPFAEAANLAFVGIQQDVGPGWRTPTLLKPFDPDADNVLGSDGYHLINVPPAWPSYVTSTEVLVGAHSGNAGYASVDQPTGMPGLFQTGALNVPADAEVSADLFRFTLGPTVVGRTIRVSLLVDNLDDASFNAASLTLVQTDGGSVATGFVQAGEVALNNRKPDWVTFEIADGKPGDVFVIRGTGGSNLTASLGGVAFDSTATFGTDGEFTQQALLTGVDLFDADEISGSIAVSGDTLVVGKSLRGEVAVMVRDGSTWVRQALLRPHNPGEDLFGFHVALSGDTLIVGAPLEASVANTVNSPQGADDSISNSGAAYVFVRHGTNWTQQAYLKSADNRINLFFGGVVTLSGNTAVVGSGMARRAEGHPSLTPRINFPSTANNGVGAVYTFVRTGTNWTQQARLTPDNGEPGDGFGISVALSEDTVVVGSPFEASASTQINGDGTSNVSKGAGAAYVFTRKEGSWSQQAYLKANNNDPGNPYRDTDPTNLGDRFGWQVALSGNTALIGAPLEDSLGLTDNNLGTNNGAAYVFVRSQDQWTQQAMLKATDQYAAAFGTSVSLSGDKALVGDWFDTRPSTYVFQRNGSSWSRRTDLIGPSNFGNLTPAVLSLSGGTAAIRVLTNVHIFSVDAPRLHLEDEAGFTLAQPTAVRTMALQDGLADEWILTLRNTGTVVLTNIAATLIGPDAGRFHITVSPAAFLPPGNSTTLTLRFTDASGAMPKQATLRLTSSDAERSPWLLNLTGISLLSTADSDFDGLNDVAEFRLRDAGFDPFLRQPTLVKALNLGGLYGAGQIPTLNVGQTLLRAGPSGAFRLTLGMQKATHLTNFTPFPFLAPQTTINGQGQVEFEFTSPENAAFYLLNVE